MPSATTPHRRLFRTILVALVVTAAVAARPNPAAAPTFHWCVTGPFRDQIDLSGTPIRDDAAIFYEHDFGLIPRFWKGKPERGGVPQAVDMNAHLAKLRKDIEKQMPNPDFSGYGIIDLEAWGPLWEHATEEYHQLSISIAQRNHPERPRHEIERIARANYELGARNLLEKTLRECKAIRPRVKWGFYSWPDLEHGPNLERLSWLWDACTALFPTCYTIYKGKEGGQHLEGYAPPREHVEDWKARIALHRRIAGPTKPVIAVVWVRYHEINGVFGHQYLEPDDLRRMIRTPLDAGAEGLVFWDVVTSEAMAREYQRYLTGQVVPALRR